MRVSQRGASVRQARESEMRAVEPVHEDEDQPWVRPTSLDAPLARPGYRQKWVRVSLEGKDDFTNMSRKIREGWSPRDPSTVAASFSVPTMQHGRLGSVIMVEGMVLCEMPETRALQRDAYYEQKKLDMTKAIDQELDKENVRHPGFGRIKKAEVSKSVREVRAAPDEVDAD